MTELNLKAETTVEARVFRLKKNKPRYIPHFLWKYGQKKRLWFRGYWEDLGIIAVDEA